MQQNDPTETPIKFALVGCGEIAVQSALALSQIPSASITHCFDTRNQLAEDLAKKHSALIAPTFDDILSSNVDVVIISTPHHLHEPLSIAALESGKHCITEKPIACTLPQADRMIEASKKHNRPLSVLYPERYTFTSQKTIETIKSGKLGKLLYTNITCAMNKKEAYWSGGYSQRVKDDWRTSIEKSGGGVLIMNGSHNLDTLLHITQNHTPLRAYAEYDTFRSKVEVEDFISLIIRMRDHSMITMNFTSAGHGGGDNGERLYFENGQIHIQNEKGQLRLLINNPELPPSEQQWETFKLPENFPSARFTFLSEYCRAFTDNTPLPGSVESARTVLEIIRGAYLSMKRNAPATFPLEDLEN